jgi:hypothetical protein
MKAHFMHHVAGLLVSTFVFCASVPCEAGGFFRRSPEVGEWARYEIEMLMVIEFKDETVAGYDPIEFSGSLTLKCVGEATIEQTRCVWLESKLDVRNPLGNERWAVHKILVPVDQVAGDELIDHIVRGWRNHNFADDVSELVMDGREFQEDPWEYLLILSFSGAGDLVESQQQKSLTINNETVELTQCETGSLEEHQYDDARVSGEATWWPSADHPFGIAAAEQLWSANINQPFEAVIELAVDMDLKETGTEAVSDLPDHN